MEEQENIVYVKIRMHINSNTGLRFFTRRVINYWNQLTDVVFSCKSLSTFKIKLNEFMTARGEFNFIVVQLMHDSFLFHLLFCHTLSGWASDTNCIQTNKALLVEIK